MLKRAVKILVSFFLLWGPFIGCCLDESFAASGKPAILKTVQVVDSACADTSDECCDKSSDCLQSHEVKQKALVSSAAGFTSADFAFFVSSFVPLQLTKPLVFILAGHINSVPIYLNFRNLRL